MELLTNTHHKNYNCNANSITIINEVNCMADYKQMYAIMFRAAEMAVRYTENNEPKNAILALKLAQLICENIYIESDENEE